MIFEIIEDRKKRIKEAKKRTGKTGIRVRRKKVNEGRTHERKNGRIEGLRGKNGRKKKESKEKERY